LQALHRRDECGAVVDDVVADIGEFGERPAVGDVELRERDRAIGADLLGLSYGLVTVMSP